MPRMRIGRSARRSARHLLPSAASETSKLHEDVLHVVVVLERLDEPDELLARLVVDGDGVLRPPDQRRLARLAEARLERLRDLAERALARSRSRGRPRSRRRRRRRPRSPPRASRRRRPASASNATTPTRSNMKDDGAGLGEVAAVLGEVGADVGGGAVAVVGQRLDDERRRRRGRSPRSGSRRSSRRRRPAPS